MNPFPGSSTLALALLLAGATLGPMATLVAAAEPAQPTAPAAETTSPPSVRPRAAAGRPGAPGAPGTVRARGVEFARVLTDAQRDQFREAMIAQRETLRDLEERLPRLRRAVSEATLAQPLDEAAVRQAARALGDAEAERTLARARALAKVRPSLSEDQVRQLGDMMADPGAFLRPFASDAAGRNVGPGPGAPDRPAREGSDLPPPRRAKPSAPTP